jgi:beta-glucosidase
MNSKSLLIRIAIITMLMFTQMAYAQHPDSPALRSDNIDEVLKTMTTEEKCALLVGGAGMVPDVPDVAGYTRTIPRLGIPMTALSDGPAGLRINPTREGTDQTFYCTAFPNGTLTASSWNPTMVERMTQAMGSEVLEYGVDVLLAPGMNIHRNPLCGRNFEYFSEDPLLSGRIAAAYVRGVQSQGVGCSVKHFAANNQETNRLENDARISERALREIYLKNFEIAIKEGRPWTVMSSYNKLNGEYTQQSHRLLTTILRDEWGFDGLVMTDWGCKDSTVKSAKAGNDLMEPGHQRERDRLMAAVESGELTQSELDRNVRRVLEYIVKTPHFRKYPYSNHPDLQAHAQVARKAAEESIVLLRNENGALPLNGGEKVALYGISSVDFFAVGTGSGFVHTAHVTNMQEALTAAGFSLDEDLANYYRHCYALQQDKERMETSSIDKRHRPEPEVSVKAIERQAQTNDVAIIVLGRIAGEGADRVVHDDFELTAIERELIQNVSLVYHKAGKRVVVVLNIVGVVETASWKGLVDAIILPWTPGQEGAHAVADIIRGKVNPSGKLPMTFPANYMDIPSADNFPYRWDPSGRRGTRRNVDFTEYWEGIWVGYRHFLTRNVEVSYPFGHGLSYTTFDYGQPKVKATKDGFTATITVTNTGNVPGREVVELYVSAPSGGLEKPDRELKAFAKTKTLAPGESETLTMTVTDYELASFNESTAAWETAVGTYKLLFGASATDIRRTASFKMKNAVIIPVAK